MPRDHTMKTLDVHDKNLKEISSLVEQFIETGERPIQIMVLMMVMVLNHIQMEKSGLNI